jgi:hypothetical protein
VQQFALEAPGVVPWREENLQVGAQVSGRIAGTSLDRVSAATFGIISATDQLEATLTHSVDDPSATTRWPVRFSMKGDLATWQPRVQAFVPLAGWRTAGGIDLQGEGSFSPEITELQTTKQTLNKLAVSGPGLDINEPQVILETVGSWDQKKLTFISTATTLATSAVALRADNIKAVLGGATPIVQGVIDYRGDLSRLMTWVPSAEPRTTQFTGMLEGRLEAALRDGKVEAAWTNDIKDFKCLSPVLPRTGRGATLASASTGGNLVPKHEEPLIKIVAQASYDPATDDLTLTRAQLQSMAASFAAEGKVTQLTRQCIADIHGQIAYDLEIITTLINENIKKSHELAKSQSDSTPQVDPLLMPVLMGKETRKFLVKGPLLPVGPVSSGGGASGPLVHPELVAQAEFGWQGASYAGLKAGPGVVPANLARGMINVGPLDLPVNEGRVTGTPRLNLNSPSLQLELDRGPLIQGVRLSREMCEDWMKFVAPFLAGVTSAEGKISLDLDGAKIPLTDTSKGTVAGIMTIHTAEVGPGPLGQSYLDIAKRMEAIAKGNYAELGSFLGVPNPAAPPPTPNTPNRGVLILPEQQVKFEMIEGRVHHQGLKMNVRDVVITTRGSVGLDQTMELVAEVPIQDAWLKSNASLASLKGQMLQIPIRGTLTSPRPDLQVITNLVTNLGGKAATGMIQDRVGKEINKFLPGFNPNAPLTGTTPAAPGAAPGTAPTQPAAPTTQDLLNGVRGIFGPK